MVVKYYQKRYVFFSTKGHNSFIAIRNSKYLRTLYSNKKFTKLKFFDSDKIVGWSISLCSKLNDHHYFGDMKLGSIVDCFCLAGYEKIIVNSFKEVLYIVIKKIMKSLINF